MKAANINHVWAKLIIDELVRNGIHHFVLAPGSRSAPLAIAVAERDDVTVSIHVDERGCAFRALGIGKATNKPAALICTSGTAVANYYPAIIEASMAHVPMIILSADRPAELRSAGASQTIDQVMMFGNYVRWFHDLVAPNETNDPQYVLTTIDQAVHRSMANPAGPVHINCQFREPLAPIGDPKDFTEYLRPIAKWTAGMRPYTSYLPAQTTPDPENTKHLFEIVQSAIRGVIVAGEMPVGGDRSAIVRLAEKWQWPLIADVCSGIRFTGSSSKSVFCHSDIYLRMEKFQRSLNPDVVIQFGRLPISKTVHEYVNSRTNHYILINDDASRIDPSHRVTTRVQADPNQQALFLLESGGVNGSELLPQFEKFEDFARTAIHKLGDNHSDSVSELLTVSEVFRGIHSTRGVYLATSMPIREADAVVSQSDHPMFVAANRGANGIDGTIATAVGFAEGLQLPVTLLIGDLAALHDLNSLSMVAGSKYPVTVVVINNDGGGIFSFLPIAKHREHFEEYFGTPHGFQFQYAAEMFRVKYHNPGSMKDFATVYRHSLKSQKPAIIEVLCDRTQSCREHEALWKAVDSRIEKEVLK